MALRHRHKARSWHWMRKELPRWYSTYGVLGSIFDHMAEESNRRMMDTYRDICVTACHDRADMFRSIEMLARLPNPDLVMRPIIDSIWFDEAADFPPVSFDTIQKRIVDRSLSISSLGAAELHFEGMVLPITDLKFQI